MPAARSIRVLVPGPSTSKDHQRDRQQNDELHQMEESVVKAAKHQSTARIAQKRRRYRAAT